MSITWVDSSDCTHLAKCPCGWRLLCSTAQTAYTALAKHEAGWHPDRRNARVAAHMFTTRHADTLRPGNTPMKNRRPK